MIERTDSNTFSIEYDITVLPGENIDDKLKGICLEQSVELPSKVLSDDIKRHLVGQVQDYRETGKCLYHAIICYPIDNAANEITQLLNILYGNISLKPGIKITGLEWGKMYHLFQGPAVGIEKFRKKWNIPKRGLSATALKPMGFSPEQLADLCYEFAVGGIDIIKDDHGLTDQPYAPFEARVKACVAAIKRASDATGRRSLYFPNITTSPGKLVDRYKNAAKWGADGVLLAPHLCGLEMMHILARMDINLPIMAHPSFSGSLVTNKSQGFTSDFLYGQLWRALGADFMIYPNAGGRFSFTIDECQKINESARNDKINFKRSFPTPGGGLQRDDLEKWLSAYGRDTVFLMGGSLYQHSKGIREAGEEIRYLLEEMK